MVVSWGKHCFNLSSKNPFLLNKYNNTTGPSGRAQLLCNLETDFGCITADSDRTSSPTQFGTQDQHGTTTANSSSLHSEYQAII